jgi:asparaginyl-tRNA synthetase
MTKNKAHTEAIITIQSEIRRILGEELRKKGFIEISPVILSPLTDPLNHPTTPAHIHCYGKKYNITQSMIFHKQVAIRTLGKIFVFSPNVRLEALERKKTGQHLFEFTQLDLEIKHATREDVMALCEDLLHTLLTKIKKNNKKELHEIKRNLVIPRPPFKRIRYQEAVERYGEDFEIIISKNHTEPVWITDIPLTKREFYDREDPTHPGFLRDMDLIYPEGYGEALSGGEREYNYERIKQHLLKKGNNVADFRTYLTLAKQGLPPSAGFGIGIERLTRYICGLQRIEEASLFPKIPGKSCL